MKKIIGILFFILIFGEINAQTKSTTEIGFSGQIMMSYDGSALYYNMGGPAFFANIKKSKIGIAMYPSLKLMNDNPKPFVTPILGSGIFYQYKKIVVAMPMYFIAAENKWKLSFGLGYKF
jgi:hypothetical protein